jgi:hypothetical protein
MSARLGQPTEINVATGALAASTRFATVPSSLPTTGQGANAANQGQWFALVAFFATYVASATVGNRSLSLVIKDAAGNILWQALQGTAVTAGQTVNFIAGGGSGPAAVTGPPITQTLQLPVDFPVPPGGTIGLLDGAAISNADTVAINVVGTY